MGVVCLVAAYSLLIGLSYRCNPSVGVSCMRVLLIYIYIYIYIYMCVCVCVCVCACVVHLLVWIINCTRCTVHASKYIKIRPTTLHEFQIELIHFSLYNGNFIIFCDFHRERFSVYWIFNFLQQQKYLCVCNTVIKQGKCFKNSCSSQNEFRYPSRYLLYATFGTLCVFSISIENILYIRFIDKIIPRIGVFEELIVDLMSLFQKVCFWLYSR